MSTEQQADAEATLREFIRAQIAKEHGESCGDITLIRAEAKRVGVDESTLDRKIDEEFDAYHPERRFYHPKFEGPMTKAEFEADATPIGLHNNLRRANESLPMMIGIEGVGKIHVGYFQKQDWESEEIRDWLQRVANYTLDLWNLFRHLEPDLTRALRDKGTIGLNDLFTDLAIMWPDQARKAIANPEKAEKFVSEYREKQQSKKQSVETEEHEENIEDFRERSDQQYASLDEGFPNPMSKEAFHGIAGEVIDIISPQAESSKEALLAQFLVAMGNLIGHGAYFPQAGWHCLNEYIAIVGATSRGRKGTGWTAIKNLLASIDNDWASGRVIGGIPSGEGIIENVRDAREITKQSYKSKLAGKEPEVTIDEGVEDKRLLLMEEELRRFLSAGGRTTNTLFDVARLA